MDAIAINVINDIENNVKSEIFIEKYYAEEY